MWTVLAGIRLAEDRRLLAFWTASTHLDRLKRHAETCRP